VTEIVRRTPVETSTARLTVSTIRVAPGYYVTVDIAAHPNKPTPGETP
jgi:hypothetical protein